MYPMSDGRVAAVIAEGDSRSEVLYPYLIVFVPGDGYWRIDWLYYTVAAPIFESKL